jgi:hypothetical protein
MQFALAAAQLDGLPRVIKWHCSKCLDLSSPFCWHQAAQRPLKNCLAAQGQAAQTHNAFIASRTNLEGAKT